MSTLVKIVLTIVLNVLHGGETPEHIGSATIIDRTECVYQVHQLNPDYIISVEQLKSQTNLSI